MTKLQAISNGKQENSLQKRVEPSCPAKGQKRFSDVKKIIVSLCSLVS